MEVIKIKPFGFCAGVDTAIKLALEAKNENPNKNVYLLGMLVHNEEVITSLVKKGLIILDEHTNSLENLLSSVEDESVIVFSAHGHSKKLYEIALSKRLKIYDSTCTFVKENMELGETNNSIIYIGVKGHLESDAFMSNNSHASFYDLKTNTWDYSSIKVKNPKVISQTTISSLELNESINKIKSIFPDCEILQERCHSTSQRQNEISNLTGVDYLIILGSRTSNNSKKLAEIGSFKGIETYLCSSLDEVKQLKLNSKKKVALASGASTSRDTFLEVATYLESLD